MLFAVHISDGFFAAPWCLAGFAVAGLLAWFFSRRVDEEEIPRIALMTAAIFIASTIHVRVPITSVHLLLNGLVGVILGGRAVIAIAVGLFLQALLLNHGGFTTWGVNLCVQAIPALLAGWAFHAIHRLTCWRTNWFRSLLVGLSSLAVVTTMVVTTCLLIGAWRGETELHSLADACLTPWVGIPAGIVLGIAIIAERRLASGPEFALGFLIGVGSVLLTVSLLCVVLILGGETHWAKAPPLILLLVHVPIALVEGGVVGVTVGFLKQVRPQILGLTQTKDDGQQHQEPFATNN